MAHWPADLSGAIPCSVSVVAIPPDTGSLGHHEVNGEPRELLPWFSPLSHPRLAPVTASSRTWCRIAGQPPRLPLGRPQLYMAYWNGSMVRILPAGDDGSFFRR
jgi:hypothetical protein